MASRMLRLEGLLALAALANALAPCIGEPGARTANALITTFSSFPDPLHWRSFYSLPRTLAAARQDGWGLAFASRPAPVRASTWCREDDYRLCLLFDAQGSVAGLQVSVAVRDYEESFDNIHYPIHLETEWKRQTLLDTEVYSATALFVSPSVLSDGGRPGLDDRDATVPEKLFLQNGNGFWAMPAHASDAVDVAYTMQGCVKGMGRHFFYSMSPDTACEELRPFFLLFDDVTGVLQGFGITLFGKASDRGWLKRKWLEAPGVKLIEDMIPGAPLCLGYYAERHGFVALHVYFTPSPWAIQCAARVAP